MIEAYLKIGRELARLGFRTEPGLTARDYLAGAAAAYEPLGEPLSKLTPIYERAAFSPAQPDEGALKTAWDASRQVAEFVRDALARARKRR